MQRLRILAECLEQEKLNFYVIRGVFTHFPVLGRSKRNWFLLV